MFFYSDGKTNPGAVIQKMQGHKNLSKDQRNKTPTKARAPSSNQYDPFEQIEDSKKAHTAIKK